jgi:hypothetical protein
MKTIKRLLPGVIIIMFLALCQYGCSQADKEPVPAKSETIVKSENVRKTGTIELEVPDTGRVRAEIGSLAEEHEGQVLSESIDVGDDGRRTLHYRIKVPAKHFSVFMEKASTSGRLLDMKIAAEDVSGSLEQAADRIDLLRRRLHRARQDGETSLADSLREKLAKAEGQRALTRGQVLYSYINITARENMKISHAFIMGYYYGKAGLVWMVKFIVMMIITLIPLLFVYLIIRIILSLVRPWWRGLIGKIEGNHPNTRE